MTDRDAFMRNRCVDGRPRRLRLLYDLLRGEGNGLIQSLWKVLGAACGRKGVMMSPTQWQWVKARR